MKIISKFQLRRITKQLMSENKDVLDRLGSDYDEEGVAYWDHDHDSCEPNETTKDAIQEARYPELHNAGLKLPVMVADDDFVEYVLENAELESIEMDELAIYFQEWLKENT